MPWRALHAGGLRDHTAVPFGFAYETNPPFCPAFGSMRAEPLPIRSAIARFPLGLSIDTRESSPIASFSTPKSEGARESVALFADAFRVVVEELRASRAEGEPFAGVQLPPSHTGLAEQEAKPTSRGMRQSTRNGQGAGDRERGLDRHRGRSTGG